MAQQEMGQHPEEEGLQPASAGLREAGQLQLAAINQVDMAAQEGLGVMLTAVQAEMRAHLIQTQLAEAVGEAGLEQAEAAAALVELSMDHQLQWQEHREQADRAQQGDWAEQGKLSPAQ